MPVGVPERTGVALVDVSVDVSASVSFEVDGVSEVGGVVGSVIEVDSWMIPNSVGAEVSVDSTLSSCIGVLVRHVINDNTRAKHNNNEIK